MSPTTTARRAGVRGRPRPALRFVLSSPGVVGGGLCTTVLEQKSDDTIEIVQTESSNHIWEGENEAGWVRVDMIR